MKLEKIKPEAIHAPKEEEEKLPSLSDELLESVVGGLAALNDGCCRYRYSSSVESLSQA
jgi:hypothetical protein